MNRERLYLQKIKGRRRTPIIHRSFPSSFFNSILVSECEVNLIDGYPFPILQSYKHCLLNISFFAISHSCAGTMHCLLWKTDKQSNKIQIIGSRYSGSVSFHFQSNVPLPISLISDQFLSAGYWYSFWCPHPFPKVCVFHCPQRIWPDRSPWTLYLESHAPSYH